MAYRKRFI